MKITRNQNGFTLLEMLISSAIFAIVLFAIYTIHITTQETTAGLLPQTFSLTLDVRLRNA